MKNIDKKDIDKRIEELLSQLGKTKADLAKELEELIKWSKQRCYLKSFNEFSDIVSLEYMLFLKWQFEARVEDAYNHAENLNYKISKQEAEYIAFKFISKNDCNISENEQFDNLVEEIVAEERELEDRNGRDYSCDQDR